MSRRAYSPNEVMKQLGISKNLIYKLLKTRKIKSIRAGKRILIPDWALEEFLSMPRTADISKVSTPKR